MEDTMFLIERSHHGDKEAREILVQENTGLVWSIVRRYMGRGTDSEDLFQIGIMGLIKAIDKFDLSYQVKFSTYAVPMIAGEIRRFLRDDGIVKVSRTLKENSWKIRRESDLFRQRNGSEISLLDRLQVENTRTEELLNRVMLEQLLAQLPEKERRLIIMRYLQDCSQTEVARMMGVSQVQVSRLEKKILKQMRERLTGE